MQVHRGGWDQTQYGYWASTMSDRIKQFAINQAFIPRSQNAFDQIELKRMQKLLDTTEWSVLVCIWYPNTLFVKVSNFLPRCSSSTVDLGCVTHEQTETQLFDQGAHTQNYPRETRSTLLACVDVVGATYGAGPIPTIPRACVGSS